MAMYMMDGVYHWRKMIDSHKFNRSTKTSNKFEAEQMIRQWEADAVRGIQIMCNKSMELHERIKPYRGRYTNNFTWPVWPHYRHFIQ